MQPIEQAVSLLLQETSDGEVTAQVTDIVLEVPLGSCFVMSQPVIAQVQVHPSGEVLEVGFACKQPLFLRLQVVEQAAAHCSVGVKDVSSSLERAAAGQMAHISKKIMNAM